MLSTHKKAIVLTAIARLRRSPYRAVRHLSCEMVEGALILHGQVSTFFEKQQAQEAVRDIEGVRRINNKVIVGS